MPNARTPSSYFAELVVVFAGVLLAFAVDNFREAHNDRAIGDQYLSAFRQDLTADRRIENGLRLIVANLDFDHESLLPLLERARTQVEQLLQQIPAR